MGIRRFGAKRIEVDPEGQDPYSANVGGFSLNARVWIAGNDRKKLEQLFGYAEMLKRVFNIDVTICPKCQGRMEQIAVIKDKVVAKKNPETPCLFYQ